MQVADAFTQQQQQQQQQAALLATSGWVGLVPAAAVAPATGANRADASHARWAEAQGENDAAPDAAAEEAEGAGVGGGDVGSEQQHGGATQQGSHSKAKRPPGSQQCPRCNSKNTKFCYYNNYNIKQPRYYCRVSAGLAGAVLELRNKI